MQEEELFECIIQGTPIVLALSYLLYPSEFVGVSHSVLGKCIAILIIALYSFKHVVCGFLAVLVVTWYYQKELDVFLREGFDKSEYLPKPAKKRGGQNFIPTLHDDQTTYAEAYPTQLHPVQKEREGSFRKQHCGKRNVLTHKDMEVKDIYAPHVFPELSFVDKPCNPCDRTCKIELKKQDTERLIEPIQTRGSPLDALKSILPFSGEPFVGTNKELATFL